MNTPINTPLPVANTNQPTTDKWKIAFSAIGKNLYSWQWSKSLFFWIIFSAGTFSELAFLAASIWMSINATENKFLLTFMTSDLNEKISFVASSIYVILPVCILPLAGHTVLKHLFVWQHEKKFGTYSFWCLLYALPTITFLIIDAFIISNSNVPNYTLPDILVRLRADMAYLYGLIAVINHFAGQEQERDRLAKRDNKIAELQNDLTQLQKNNEERVTQLQNQNAATLASIRSEYQRIINELKRELFEANSEKNELEKTKTQLINAVQKSSEQPLQAYSSDCRSWLMSGIKTAKVDDIVAYTGISKRRISGAIRSKKLQTSSRNDDLVMVTSLVNWLETQLPNDDKDTDSMPVLQLVSSSN